MDASKASALGDFRNHAQAPDALAKDPLPVLAQVLGQSPDDLKTRLEKAGLPVDTETQTLADLVGPDLKAQIGTLRAF